MDFSESSVWTGFIQFGVLCLILLAANTLRRYVPFLRKSLLPTAVIGGLIALAFRSAGLDSLFDTRFLNMITYHFMAIGFIALSLKTSYGKGEMKRQASKDAFNSGLLIVGSYLLQALIGFSITIILALTFMPDLFKAWDFFFRSDSDRDQDRQITGATSMRTPTTLQLKVLQAVKHLELPLRL